MAAAYLVNDIGKFLVKRPYISGVGQGLVYAVEASIHFFFSSISVDAWMGFFQYASENGKIFLNFLGAVFF